MGKVHGSLARAGTSIESSEAKTATILTMLQERSAVRHQRSVPLSRAARELLIDSAAQVEKTEKKKVPKGRAKKRLVYSRRFNMTTIGGKRKVCLHDVNTTKTQELTRTQMNANPTT